MADDPIANSLAPGVRNRSTAEGDVPETLRRRYYVDGRGGAGLGFYADATVKAPAFRDAGRQLVAARNDPNAIRDMTAIARHRGWTIVVAKGEVGFRREAWLAGRAVGLEARLSADRTRHPGIGSAHRPPPVQRGPVGADTTGDCRADQGLRPRRRPGCAVPSAGGRDRRPGEGLGTIGSGADHRPGSRSNSRLAGARRPVRAHADDAVIHARRSSNPTRTPEVASCRSRLKPTPFERIFQA